jgi:uncharacterized protein YndB with AHSA1/START domain
MTDRHEFEFEIDAPRAEVWRALVDPDALRGWFATEARVSPEVGGEWFVAHGEHAEGSTIEEIVPQERLRTVSGEMITEFVLEGREGTTLLRIVHSGFGGDVRESLENGWAQYMQTLRHFLARHPAEAAAATYLYAESAGNVEQTRAVLPKTLPDGADIFDEWPRSIGARIPELGDGMYRASVEGGDGRVSLWIHLVAYGVGRGRLDAVAQEVGRKLRDLVPQMPSPANPRAHRT